MNEWDERPDRTRSGSEPSGLKVVGVVLLIIAAIFVLLVLATVGSMNFDFDPCTC